MVTAARSASSDTVRADRIRLRKQGLSKAFARTAHRQALAVAKSSHAKRDQAFVDAISAWDEE